ALDDVLQHFSRAYPLPGAARAASGCAWTAASLEIDFGEVERRVGNNVHAGELLVVRGKQSLGDQRRPRRIVPRRLLRILVQRRLLGGVGGELRFLDVGVELRVLVVRRVEQARRERAAEQQRTQRPVG